MKVNNKTVDAFDVRSVRQVYVNINFIIIPNLKVIINHYII